MCKPLEYSPCVGVLCVKDRDALWADPLFGRCSVQLNAAQVVHTGTRLTADYYPIFVT
jgi:hypothetical protein